jgi:hypothetical protein
MSSLYLSFYTSYRGIQKAKTDRFSILNAGFKAQRFSQTLGQQLGTLVPRPQNPWAVQGEQFTRQLGEHGTKILLRQIVSVLSVSLAIIGDGNKGTGS